MTLKSSCLLRTARAVPVGPVGGGALKEKIIIIVFVFHWQPVDSHKFLSQFDLAVKKKKKKEFFMLYELRQNRENYLFFPFPGVFDLFLVFDSLLCHRILPLLVHFLMSVLLGVDSTW